MALRQLLSRFSTHIHIQSAHKIEQSLQRQTAALSAQAMQRQVVPISEPALTNERATAAPSGSVQPDPRQNQAPKQAAAPGSWSARLTSKSTWGAKFSSVNRTKKMHVRDLVSTTNTQRSSLNKRYAALRPGPSAKTSKDIRKAIGKAMQYKTSPIWVSYSGHHLGAEPFIPRAIRPLKWILEDNSDLGAIVAIEHCSGRNLERYFILDKVVEARDKHWKIPRSTLSVLKSR